MTTPKPYFKDADRDQIRRRLAEQRADAELKAAAGDVDHKKLALAFHRAIDAGVIVKSDGPDGVSEIAMADGSDLDLDALLASYAPAEIDDEETP